MISKTRGTRKKGPLYHQQLLTLSSPSSGACWTRSESAGATFLGPKCWPRRSAVGPMGARERGGGSLPAPWRCGSQVAWVGLMRWIHAGCKYGHVWREASISCGWAEYGRQGQGGSFLLSLRASSEMPSPAWGMIAVDMAELWVFSIWLEWWEEKEDSVFLITFKWLTWWLWTTEG